MLYINIEINDLQFTNTLLKTYEIVKFHIYAIKQKNIWNYFLVEENKRTPHQIISQHKHVFQKFSV